MNIEPEEALRPCNDNYGSLPSCAPLAVPLVPFQAQGARRYSPSEALTSGTLFPGLDLPFRLKAKAGNPIEGAAAELQALCFVIEELNLYLDTHKDDAEAFRLFQQYSKLAKTATQRYEAVYGPLTLKAAADRDQFLWLDDPWPWEYAKEGGGK